MYKIAKRTKKNRKKLKRRIKVDSTESILAQYLKEIDKFKLLSREEEEYLSKLSYDGDKDAREKLIKSNLRFVVNTAKKYQKRGLPLIDLINEGNLGLIYAADKFDYRKGYHFISYAIWWIRQAILKALAEKAKLIRLPLNRASQLVKIEKMKKEFCQENCGTEDVSTTDIATSLKYRMEDIASITNASKDYIPLDYPILSSEDSERILSDTLEDNNFKSPENVIVDDSLQRIISETLETLPQKEKEIICLRFGLEGRDPKSLKEIGEEFNLTKERIRQIERKAIKRLRHPSRSVNLKMFLLN